MADIATTIDTAVYEFNRIRVPEIEAKILERTTSKIRVFFSGSFCSTCGYYDYFDDFLYTLLDDYGIETKITGVEQEEDGDIVSYEIVKKG